MPTGAHVRICVRVSYASACGMCRAPCPFAAGAGAFPVRSPTVSGKTGGDRFEKGARVEACGFDVGAEQFHEVAGHDA